MWVVFAEGRSDTEEQDEGEAAQLTYIHHHIKQFQVSLLAWL